MEDLNAYIFYLDGKFKDTLYHVSSLYIDDDTENYVVSSWGLVTRFSIHKFKVLLGYNINPHEKS